MKLTNDDYSALRVFLLKVINHSESSLEEADVLAAKEVLNKLLNTPEEPKEFIANCTGLCLYHPNTLTVSGKCSKCEVNDIPF